MKAVINSFVMMLSLIKRDFMLFAACLAPILAGLFFKLGIPMIETILREQFSMNQVIGPYYGIIDMCYTMLSPILFCFIAAMIVLEERDDRITNYMLVTPLGKFGYLFTRLGIPAGISFVITALLLPLISLTDLTLLMSIICSIAGTLQGFVVSLLIVVISSNKLEGMAVTKLSTITMFGMIIPYVIPSNIQYIGSVLPSFWFGKIMYEQQFLYIIPTVIVAFTWIGLLARRYLKRIF